MPRISRAGAAGPATWPSGSRDGHRCRWPRRIRRWAPRDERAGRPRKADPLASSRRDLGHGSPTVAMRRGPAGLALAVGRCCRSPSWRRRLDRPVASLRTRYRSGSGCRPGACSPPRRRARHRCLVRRVVERGRPWRYSSGDPHRSSPTDARRCFFSRWSRMHGCEAGIGLVLVDVDADGVDAGGAGGVDDAVAGQARDLEHDVDARVLR